MARLSFLFELCRLCRGPLLLTLDPLELALLFALALDLVGDGEAELDCGGRAGDVDVLGFFQRLELGFERLELVDLCEHLLAVVEIGESFELLEHDARVGRASVCAVERGECAAEARGELVAPRQDRLGIVKGREGRKRYGGQWRGQAELVEIVIADRVARCFESGLRQVVVGLLALW